MDGRMRNSRDGGWGWMIVASSFVTLIFTRSVARCLSIFFVEFQMQFSTDYSTTSWIHSLLDFTTMLFAPLGSCVGNCMSTRIAVMTGGLLSSVGLVLSSFAPSLQFLYMSLGILTGLGFALSYTPAVAMVDTYFNKRKALAYGIAMSGRGIGIFILPPLLQYLINLYSWRGALLILGGLVSNLCVCGSLMRPLVVQNKGEKENAKPIFDELDVQGDLKAVKLVGMGPGFLIKQSRKRRELERCFFPPSSDKYSFLLKPDFLLFSVSVLFLAFGYSLPFVYLVPYSLSMDISQHQAVLFMSILGVMGIVGNITFGLISDKKCLRTFRVITFLITVGFEGLACLFVPLLRSFSTLVSFSIFFGFFDGVCTALTPVVTCDIVGSAHLSSALGVIGFLHAIPYLISPPIAGWLLDQSGSYTVVFLFSGLSLLCSSFILAALSVLRHCCREHAVSLQNHHQA
ncbi:monocarboxylate transporter 12-B-like [Neoarius graeffei]|uniref:monocarboxylate transporter 12-B-like n=1 Tax=Neoarius graeffei TaxID=443677 RepID=UPI00298CE01E|nr:monocarboxylate transporter 12-B-like [Neoarius graeffei]